MDCPLHKESRSKEIRPVFVARNLLGKSLMDLLARMEMVVPKAAGILSEVAFRVGRAVRCVIVQHALEDSFGIEIAVLDSGIVAICAK